MPSSWGRRPFAGSRAGLWGLRSMRCSHRAPAVSSEERLKLSTWPALCGCPSSLSFRSSFLSPSSYSPLSMYQFQPCSLSEEPCRQEGNSGPPSGGSSIPGPSLLGLATPNSRPGSWPASWTQGTEGGCRSQQGPACLTLQSEGQSLRGRSSRRSSVSLES